jgi:hypothetical protein
MVAAVEAELEEPNINAVQNEAGSVAAAAGAVATAGRHSSSLHSRHSRMGSRAALLTLQRLVLWPDSQPVCAIFIGHLEKKQRSVRPPASYFCFSIKRS